MQYSKAFIEALQFMWGAGFLSPGGADEVALMLDGHSIAGLRVLDIGAGLGGIDALLVTQHGASEVVGLDVEPLMVELAGEFIARNNLADRVRFVLAEPGPLPFPGESFDAVFSKDALVHVADKAALYREIRRVLRPGGQFIAADWLWAEAAAEAPVVHAWLSGGPLDFAFTTPGEAEEELKRAGFQEVRIVDRSTWLRESNRAEVEILSGPARANLAEKVGEELAAQRLHSAKGRQAALDGGYLRPSHLFARKP